MGATLVLELCRSVAGYLYFLKRCCVFEALMIQSGVFDDVIEVNSQSTLNSQSKGTYVRHLLRVNLIKKTQSVHTHWRNSSVLPFGRSVSTGRRKQSHEDQPRHSSHPLRNLVLARPSSLPRTTQYEPSTFVPRCTYSGHSSSHQVPPPMEVSTP